MRRIIEAAAALFELIGLSFGRIDVEPWQPRQAAASRARTTDGRLFASAACATFAGLAYWVMFALGVAILS